MNVIRAPRFSPDHPERHIDCQGAVEVCFQDIFDQAEDFGWSRAEITVAIIAAAKGLETNMTNASQEAWASEIARLLKDIARG